MDELRIVRERRPEYEAVERFLRSLDVYKAFEKHFEPKAHEEFLVVALNAKHAPIGFSVVSVGSLTASIVHPREIFKVLILANAASFFCLHNHPSGDPTPSAEDVEITRRIREAGELLGIRLLDHLVFGDGRYVSFVDQGLI